MGSRRDRPERVARGIGEPPGSAGEGGARDWGAGEAETVATSEEEEASAGGPSSSGEIF
jgi:hypothetical protein